MKLKERNYYKSKKSKKPVKETDKDHSTKHILLLLKGAFLKQMHVLDVGLSCTYITTYQSHHVYRYNP